MSSTAVAKVDYSSEEMTLIKKQFFPAGGSPVEQQYCLAVAKELGLNPITREIFFVPRRAKVNGQWVDKIEPMVGRDGFLSIGHRSGQFAGIETNTTIKAVPRLVKGNWVYHDDLVAECRVWRRDTERCFAVEVSWEEYVQKNNDGQPTKFWAEKPETMLKKVAESQALRKAFNIHGVYAPEELGAGFETDDGELIVEAEYTRQDESKPAPRLAAVPRATPATPPAPKPTRPTPPTPSSPPPSPPPPEDPDDGWPEPPEPHDEQEPDGPDEDGVRDEIIALLEGKNIPYEVHEESGHISAKSYNHKELLKQVGFKWNGDTKSWLFKYRE